ncbi:hypothetical protein V6N12_004356 [Hibiscus sabdariffa]|uniref:Uncharacterized protein n=1 Tax=Hibiscus sabdariffa TaxID=183260 RepID=A0ABR2CLA2_9ROSI
MPIGQPVTVKAAATLIVELSCNSNPVEANLIVGEWDKFEGDKIFGIPLGRVQIDELPHRFGSNHSAECYGYSYLYGVFNEPWKEGKTKEEAEITISTTTKLSSNANRSKQNKNGHLNCEYLFIGFAVLILQHREWIELSDMLEP